MIIKRGTTLHTSCQSTLTVTIVVNYRLSCNKRRIQRLQSDIKPGDMPAILRVACMQYVPTVISSNRNKLNIPNLYWIA